MPTSDRERIDHRVRARHFLVLLLLLWIPENEGAFWQCLVAVATFDGGWSPMSGHSAPGRTDIIQSDFDRPCPSAARPTPCGWSFPLQNRKGTPRETFSEKAVQAWRDFRYGIHHVSGNFLPIFRKRIQQVTVVQLALLGILGGTYLISPTSSVQLVDALSSILQTIAILPQCYSVVREKIAAMLFLLCCLPLSMALAALILMYGLASGFLLVLAKLITQAGFPEPAMIITSLVKKVFLSPLKLGEKFLFKAESWIDLEGSVVVELVLLCLQIVLVSPFVEEVLFRFLPDHLERVCTSSRRKSTKQTTLTQSSTRVVDKTEPRLWFGRYRTVHLVSSILFATLHIPTRHSPISESVASNISQIFPGLPTIDYRLYDELVVSVNC